jgi:hypothetical protein
MKGLLSRMKAALTGEPTTAASTPVPPAAPPASPPPAPALDAVDATHAAGDPTALLINAYCTVGDLPAMDFPHGPVTRRDLSDPDLTPHLQGFVNYVASRGDGQMTSTRYHVIRHLQRVRQHLSLEVPQSALEAFAHWAEHANALVFLPDSSVRDPHGEILIDAEGNPPHPSAVVPYPQDARERKAKNDATIAARGWRVAKHLPPVPGDAEVRLRTPAEVLARASALCAVAFRAKTVHTDAPIPVPELFDRLPLARAALSPAEVAFIDTDRPSDEAAAELSWRFECLPVLEWALGLRDTLSFPDGTEDAPLALLDIPADDLMARAPTLRLRPTAEILDALDLHLRLHWMLRQARLDNVPPPDGVSPGVVAERHYALNWLTCFENAEWDDVDTPT